ncbi:MAG: tetratricopeptide repeat protein, partial [Terriglobia bacterium]
NYPAAATAINDAIKHDFHNKNLWKSAIEILFRAGLSAMVKQQYKEAGKHFNEVLTLNYKFHTARFYLAQCYMQLKDYRKALTELEELLRTAETAREERVKYFAGLTLFELGSPLAMNQFLALHQQGGDSEYVKRSLKALVYSVLTLSLDLERPYIEQLPIEPVKKKFPHWIYASYNLKLKRYDEAVKELKELLVEGPNDPKVLYFLGLTHILKGERGSGLPYWYKILEVNPGKIGDHTLVVQMYARLGFFLLEEGYTEKAMDAWERIKAFDPTHRYADYLLAQVYKQMGYILAKRDRLREGIVKWEMARKLYPKDLQLLHNLAVAFTILGELKEATRVWRLLQNQWKREIDKSPETTAHYQIWYEEVGNFLSSQEEAEKQGATALTRANADEYLSFIRRANQFYWFLGLEKNASRTDVERRYFKLIKTYSPEKHPEEFILLEEAYQYLTDPKRLEQSLLYIFEPVDFKRLAEDMRANKLSIEDFLFWDRNLLPFDRALELTEKDIGKEFGPLPPPTQVYKGMESALNLNDWAL